MKLINTLDKNDEMSPYSGQGSRNFEIRLRPVPINGEDGKPLKAAQRYYVFRLLYFTSEERRYPYIVRNEHVFFKKDFSGNIKEVRKICCPTTPWARSRINEPVDRDYCPICKFSFEQQSEGWKNYRTLNQIDETSLRAARDSERVWAAYMPVLVISDPTNPKNNNHFRVLRLSGNRGREAFDMIEKKRKEGQEKGLTMFNGGEGANIAVLCEKREIVDKKRNGEIVVDKKTGLPRTYIGSCVTDVKLLDKRLHSYDIVTEANLERLQFDETYGVPATKDQLSAFLSENYLDTGASDRDFGDDEFSAAPSVANTATPTTEPKTVKVEAEEDDFDEETTSPKTADNAPTDADEDDFEDESPRDAIARITKGTVVTATKRAKPAPAKETSVKLQYEVEEVPNTERLRASAMDISPDELPF